MAKRYWLMKTEPDVFGLEDLKKQKNQTEPWDGVRNYRARNYLRDEIQLGDGVLFYHSRITPPEVVATCKVVRAGYPDPTQFDPKEKYYDPKSPPDNPRWFCVDVQLDKEFATPVTLPELRETDGLEEMALLEKGQRLSVQPVRPEEWKIVTAMGRRKRR